MRRYNLRMATPSRASRPGTFFVTTATYNRRRLFQTLANAGLFIEMLQHYRHAGHYKLHAFVVMPDHVRFILMPQAIALERAVGFIKGGFSRRLGSKTPVWQRGFKDHRIRDAEDMQVRRDYLYHNPVRANLVAAAQLYPYSSANCSDEA